MHWVIYQCKQIGQPKKLAFKTELVPSPVLTFVFQYCIYFFIDNQYSYTCLIQHHFIVFLISIVHYPIIYAGNFEKLSEHQILCKPVHIPYCFALAKKFDGTSRNNPKQTHVYNPLHLWEGIFSFHPSVCLFIFLCL